MQASGGNKLRLEEMRRSVKATLQHSRGQTKVRYWIPLSSMAQHASRS